MPATRPVHARPPRKVHGDLLAAQVVRSGQDPAGSHHDAAPPAPSAAEADDRRPDALHRVLDRLLKIRDVLLILPCLLMLAR